MNCFAICGDSGTGKTTMATTLASCLSDAIVLECDRYHKWERHDPHWGLYTHLNPEANYIDLMQADVQSLNAQRSIVRRDYSHDTGKFTREEEIGPASNVVVCGLHALMCPHNVGVFMDTDTILKTQWKISRDIGKRGYTLEEVKKQIEDRREDYESFLQPLMLGADVIVNFCSETDLYIDSIKGIGRLLKIFVKDRYESSNILRQFDARDIEYTFSSKSDRAGFWQIDITHMSSGYYYDYAALCVLDVARQNGS